MVMNSPGETESSMSSSACTTLPATSKRLLTWRMSRVPAWVMAVPSLTSLCAVRSSESPLPLWERVRVRGPAPAGADESVRTGEVSSRCRASPSPCPSPTRGEGTLRNGRGSAPIVLRIGSDSCLAPLPSQQPRLRETRQLVEEDADEAEQEDAQEQQVHLEQLAALVDAAAEARSQVQEELGADGGEPGVDEAEMEAGDDRREGAGQRDVAQQLPAAEGQHARDLAIVRGDAAGAFGAVEDDGVERGQGDEGDLRLL